MEEVVETSFFFLIGYFMQRGVAKRELKNKTKEKNVGDDGFLV